MASTEPPAISVVGVGAVTGTPDLILFTLGVETAAATPGEAMRAAASKAAILDQVFAGHGISELDRQTVQVSVQPVFDHDRQVVSHHQATYLFRVKVRDLAAAGEVVDQASADELLSEVLRVQHIAMSFADPEAMLAEARTRAVAAARRQAEQLAAAAGVGLGPLRLLSEGPVPGFPGEPDFAGGYRLLLSAAMTVQPGSQDVSVQVLAIFDIAGTPTA